MIKYLGSKRLLVPALGAVASAVGARTAVDLFTGTTRVAQEFKRRGIYVTASDIATYSDVLAQCYIATDETRVDLDALAASIARLNELPGRPGYFTRTFCTEARFFRPENGARIDAIRDLIEQDYADSPLRPLLLTSLMLAADRVDSTTGIQMAYLKQWAPRARKDLELTAPRLLAGPGRSVLGDAREIVTDLPRVDLAYLDPPYNQHRYFSNYHIWETLIRWDSPVPYGVAQKRSDTRDESTKSIFNKKRKMPAAFAELVQNVRADVVAVSYNDEAWITPEAMVDALRSAGHEAVQAVAFDYQRYVGARIGIFSPAGQKVGTVSHTNNTEYLFVAGPAEQVAAAVAAASADPKARQSTAG